MSILYTFFFFSFWKKRANLFSLLCLMTMTSKTSPTSQNQKTSLETWTKMDLRRCVWKAEFQLTGHTGHGRRRRRYVWGEIVVQILHGMVETWKREWTSICKKWIFKTLNTEKSLLIVHSLNWRSLIEFSNVSFFCQFQRWSKKVL